MQLNEGPTTLDEYLKPSKGHLSLSSFHAIIGQIKFYVSNLSHLIAIIHDD